MPEEPQAEPRRFLLRPAAALTQLCAAGCLLLGTIAFVLVQQNKGGGGTGYVIAWAIGAMAGLVFGGLMPRGGLVSLFASAAIDAAFGIVLLVIDFPTLRAILRVLPESDVEMIGNVLVAGAIVMLVTSVMCLAAIGQARRYAKAFREAVAEAVAHDPALAQSFNAMRTVDPTTPIIPTAADTNKGWKPHKATGHTTMMIIRPPAEDARSRRRIYFALGGAAIGFGAGIGVLVTSGAKKHDAGAEVASAKGGAASGAGAATGAGGPASPRAGGAVTSSATGSASASVTGSGSGSGSAPASVASVAPSVPVRDLLATQRIAIRKADAKALAATMDAKAFAIGIDGDDLVEGRDAIEELMQRQLGDAPPDGFGVESRFTAVGEEQNVAWTAEELELTGPGMAPRRIAITQLAEFAGGRWNVVAVCWGVPVADATAERLAILGTLPRAKAMPKKLEGSEQLEKAVKAAFSSRKAFADARSEREDAFNFGSGPGERVVGGVALKRLFGRLKFELKLDGGARVAEVAPGIGWAAVNVVFTQKSSAATDVSQTFRVLAVLLREGTDWKIVQTQFSNAGPIR